MPAAVYVSHRDLTARKVPCGELYSAKSRSRSRVGGLVSGDGNEADRALCYKVVPVVEVSVSEQVHF